MRVLFLSPQPFYQERGTTIAIEMLLKVLSKRGDSVDLLTFHIGEDRDIASVNTHRISPPLAPSTISPGFSLKKVYCDLFLFRDAYRLLRKNRYDYIHAVEEGSFIALALSKRFRTPFVVDMDSAMTAQIMEKYPWAGGIKRALSWMESIPMRNASAIVPMCEDLARIARAHCSGLVHVLKDVSLVAGSAGGDVEDLRAEYGIDGPIALYVGNLETYQGIDLLLDSIAHLNQQDFNVTAVIIGGSDEGIARYKEAARQKGLEKKFLLVGPRPIANLGDYLRQADVLVSPRTKGTNTPMKVYSYLDSGVPVVATDLPTHTQVMTGDVAYLADPEEGAFAASMRTALENPAASRQVAANARALVQREHSWESFEKSARSLLDQVEILVTQTA